MKNVFRMKPLTKETVAAAIKKFSDENLPFDPEIEKFSRILSSPPASSSASTKACKRSAHTGPRCKR